MKSSRIQNLRTKIKTRTAELGIEPDHDDTGHYYKFGGVRYPSVTRKLSIIKDEGLMNWKMNRALEYVATNINTALAYVATNLNEAIDKKNLEHLLQQAKLAPQQEFEGAGDIGKAVHGWREEWFNHWIKTGSSDLMNVEFSNVDHLLPNKDGSQAWVASTEAIKRCITDLKAQPLACELRLADPRVKTKTGRLTGLGIGGTLDDLWAVPVQGANEFNVYRNGKWETWLVDLKTSNIGNKNSYYMQVALYWYMFRKLYKIKIDKLYILHTSKTRFGEYELIELKHPRRYLAMAKNALKLYDDLEELKELKKPEIARI